MSLSKPLSVVEPVETLAFDRLNPGSKLNQRERPVLGFQDRPFVVLGYFVLKAASNAAAEGS